MGCKGRANLNSDPVPGGELICRQKSVQVDFVDVIWI